MKHVSVLFALPLALTACSGGGDPEPSSTASDVTWHADVAPVMAARCGGCHQSDGIGPFPLTTYDEVAAVAGPVELSITSGSMPPWQGADDCNDYANDYSLSDEEEDMLLDWLAAGAPEGDAASAAPIEPLPPFQADLLLQLPEPFTPVQEPDDYRCQLIEWPLDETAWITGIAVEPDQQAIVHHTIVFAVPAEAADTFRAYDEAEAGPGYTCFGGPAPAIDDGVDRSDWSLTDLQAAILSGEYDPGMGAARWLGAWVPGVQARGLPAGTGLRMAPGELLVVQMHYNTQSAAPVSDQSSVALRIADSVEREAVAAPMADAGWVTGMDVLGGAMDIPADTDDVEHSLVAEAGGLYFQDARALLGLDDDDALVVHHVGHHMHLLGKTGRQVVRHADGSETCLVDIPDWDFGWQGGFTLAEPVVLRPDDELVLSCSWDNTQANQPSVDGAQQATRDVAWGEGSTDEMCLSTLYLTGE